MPKFRCNIEGCELHHCRKCGRHYEPCKETERAGGTCDGCLIERGAAECEAVTKAFGGNYEEAAKFMGW